MPLEEHLPTYKIFSYCELETTIQFFRQPRHAVSFFPTLPLATPRRKKKVQSVRGLCLGQGVGVLSTRGRPQSLVRDNFFSDKERPGQSSYNALRNWHCQWDRKPTSPIKKKKQLLKCSSGLRRHTRARPAGPRLHGLIEGHHIPRQGLRHQSRRGSGITSNGASHRETSAQRDTGASAVRFPSF